VGADNAEEGYDKTYRRQVIRLFEMVPQLGPAVIERADFEDCDVYGPAIIGLIDNVTFDSSGFDGPPEALFIEAAPDRPYLGVIGLRQVRFYGCRFHNIGVLAAPELIAEFTSGLSGGSSSSA
jgi:hypothetical protein